MLPLLNSWLCGISAGVVCEYYHIFIAIEYVKRTLFEKDTMNFLK